MSVTEPTIVRRGGPAADDLAHAGTSSRWRSWLSLLLVVLVAMVVWGMLAIAQRIPVVYPDESLYGNLAKSLGNGDGLNWRGEPMHFRAALYVYAISPAWMLASGATAYTIAKLAGAVSLCLTPVPVWLVIRRWLPAGLALGIAVLIVSGTWMVSAASLVTETVALPLSVACLMATVMAVRSSGSRHAWLALGLAVLASAARLQNVVLVPAIGAALVLDAVMTPGGRGARLRAQALPLLAIAVLLVTGAIVLAVNGAGVLGSGGGYADVLDLRPPIGRMLKVVGEHFLALGAMVGFVPLALLIGGSTRPVAWRDDVLRPLLIVGWIVILILCMETGFFMAGRDVGWTVQRYVEHGVPLVLAAAVLVVVRPGVLDRVAVAVAGLSVFLLAAVPTPRDFVEERASFAVLHSAATLIPGIGMYAAVLAWVVAAGAVWAFLAAVGRRREWPEARAVGLVAALVAVLLAQSATAWTREMVYTQPAVVGSSDDRQWVDHHSTGPVGVLIAGEVPASLSSLELLNEHIAKVFIDRPKLTGAQLTGWVCDWRIEPDGRLRLDPACTVARHEFLVASPRVHMTFYGEVRSAEDPRVGRLVAVAGRPRVQSLVTTPCARPHRTASDNLGDLFPADMPVPCADRLDVRLWLDRPSVLRLRFRGGSGGEFHVSLGLEQHALAPGTVRTIDVPVPRGAHHEVAALDWSELSPDVPRLDDVRLVSGGRSRSLL